MFHPKTLFVYRSKEEEMKGTGKGRISSSYLLSVICSWEMNSPGLQNHNVERLGPLPKSSNWTCCDQSQQKWTKAGNTEGNWAAVAEGGTSLQTSPKNPTGYREQTSNVKYG